MTIVFMMDKGEDPTALIKHKEGALALESAEGKVGRTLPPGKALLGVDSMLYSVDRVNGVLSLLKLTHVDRETNNRYVSPTPRFYADVELAEGGLRFDYSRFMKLVEEVSILTLAEYCHPHRSEWVEDKDGRDVVAWRWFDNPLTAEERSALLINATREVPISVLKEIADCPIPSETAIVKKEIEYLSYRDGDTPLACVENFLKHYNTADRRVSDLECMALTGILHELLNNFTGFQPGSFKTVH